MQIFSEVVVHLHLSVFISLHLILHLQIDSSLLVKYDIGDFTTMRVQIIHLWVVTQCTLFARSYILSMDVGSFPETFVSARW